jgi:predicted O-methyltransferase YrrM
MVLSDITSKRRELNSYLLKAYVRNLMGKMEPRGEFEHYRELFYEHGGYMPEGRGAFEKLVLKPTDISEHLPTLYMLTRELGLKTVLELGTREGFSTIAFLEAAKAIGGTVTSVDIEPCPKAKERVASAGLEDYWTFIEGDDLAIEWDRPIDHLFIDTSHMYEHTVKELNRFEPLVADGGVITLHDVVFAPGVRQGIDEHIANRPDLRPYRFFHNNGLEVIFKGSRRP